MVPGLVLSCDVMCCCHILLLYIGVSYRSRLVVICVVWYFALVTLHAILLISFHSNILCHKTF